MNKNIISIKNVIKSYGKFQAVKNISFNVCEGDFFGFLGPNGAGKTTTVKMLTGLTSITSGTIHIFNKNMNQNSKSIKMKIGVVEDTANLFPDLTVYENLLFKAMMYDIDYTTIKSKITQYLELFNLQGKLKSKFFNLSRGQKRIISIISALLHSPDILFLDEPTLGLDINARNKIYQLLQSLHKQGITIFLTSHYFEEVEKLCDRINVINNGQIIFDGEIEKIKSYFPGEKVISIELNTPVNEEELKKYFSNVKIKKNKLFISGKDITSVLHQIEYFVNQRKIKIMEIKTEGNSLEDLFLRLVKQNEK